MKKRMLLFLILSMFINMSFVNAECTEEELNELKKQAEDIEITYEHMGEVEEDVYLITNKFEITVENIPNDVIINLLTQDDVTPQNGTAIFYLYTGTNTLEFYSNKCEEVIFTKTFKLPKYNPYYKDELCEGIDDNDFALCGKYYEGEVTYDDFLIRVKNYRITHKIDEKIENENNAQEDNSKNIIKKVLDYIIKYKINLLIVFGIILLIIILIKLINKKKKRGVLQ